MPYISTKVTGRITGEQENALKSRMGKAITLLGKPERYLMLSFEDNSRIWFSGEEGDAAFLEVSLLGSAQKSAYEKLTKELCSAINEVLSIPTDRIYVKFEETDFWGYDGYMF